MSIKLIYSPMTCSTIKQLCEDYWSFENKGGYIKYVNRLCYDYNITPNELYTAIRCCSAYIDDVRCENCGCYCPLEVPADIPYMRSKSFWFCEACVNFSGGQVLVGK